MMRDGVCDEVSNIAKCLFDGGDCCLENKDRTLCRKCACMLHVDEGELFERFEELEIKQAEGPENLRSAMADGGITVEVKNVVSGLVCATLCLDHKKANLLNAWHYQQNTETCTCGWVESGSCPERMVAKQSNYNHSYLVMNGTNIHAFVQLAKTIGCGILFFLFLTVTTMCNALCFHNRLFGS